MAFNTVIVNDQVSKELQYAKSHTEGYEEPPMSTFSNAFYGLMNTHIINGLIARKKVLPNSTFTSYGRKQILEQIWNINPNHPSLLMISETDREVILNIKNNFAKAYSKLSRPDIEVLKLFQDNFYSLLAYVEVLIDISKLNRDTIALFTTNKHTQITDELWKKIDRLSPDPFSTQITSGVQVKNVYKYKALFTPESLQRLSTTERTPQQNYQLLFDAVTHTDDTFEQLATGYLVKRGPSSILTLPYAAPFSHQSSGSISSSSQCQLVTDTTLSAEQPRAPPGPKSKKASYLRKMREKQRAQALSTRAVSPITEMDTDCGSPDTICTDQAPALTASVSLPSEDVPSAPISSSSRKTKKRSTPTTSTSKSTKKSKSVPTAKVNSKQVPATPSSSSHQKSDLLSKPSRVSLRRKQPVNYTEPFLDTDEAPSSPLSSNSSAQTTIIASAPDSVADSTATTGVLFGSEESNTASGQLSSASCTIPTGTSDSSIQVQLLPFVLPPDDKSLFAFTSTANLSKGRLTLVDTERVLPYVSTDLLAVDEIKDLENIYSLATDLSIKADIWIKAMLVKYRQIEDALQADSLILDQLSAVIYHKVILVPRHSEKGVISQPVLTFNLKLSHKPADLSFTARLTRAARQRTLFLPYDRAADSLSVDQLFSFDWSTV